MDIKQLKNKQIGKNKTSVKKNMKESLSKNKICIHWSKISRNIDFELMLVPSGTKWLFYKIVI